MQSLRNHFFNRPFHLQRQKRTTRCGVKEKGSRQELTLKGYPKTSHRPPRTPRLSSISTTEADAQPCHQLPAARRPQTRPKCVRKTRTSTNIRSTPPPLRRLSRRVPWTVPISTRESGSRHGETSSLYVRVDCVHGCNRLIRQDDDACLKNVTWAGKKKDGFFVPAGTCACSRSPFLSHIP